MGDMTFFELTADPRRPEAPIVDASMAGGLRTVMQHFEGSVAYKVGHWVTSGGVGCRVRVQ
jgi:hypothetical protein